MSLAWSFYISTVLVYLGVDIMACWGLNLQYGYTGILNFSFIIYQAAGAYTAAVLTLGPNTTGGFQQYIGGANLPFPLPVIAGGIAGGLLSVVVGVVTLRRLRADYQAMVDLDLEHLREPSFRVEPPAFHLHSWIPGERFGSVVTHQVPIGAFDGPHPFFGPDGKLL